MQLAKRHINPIPALLAAVVFCALLAASFLGALHRPARPAEAKTATTSRHRVQSQSLPDITLRPDDLEKLEAAASAAIPTHAPAGSNLSVHVWKSSGDDVTGRVEYDAAPSHGASFSAQRASDGTWVITAYAVDDACPSCLTVTP